MAYYSATGAIPSRAWVRERQAILSRRPPPGAMTMTTRAVRGLGAMPDCWSDNEVDACMESYASGDSVAAWCQKFMTNDAYADSLMADLDECTGELPKWAVPVGIGVAVAAVAGIVLIARKRKTA